MLGWFSATCLALCALPQTAKSLRTRSAGDISLAFLLMWFFGELSGFVYILPYDNWPIIVNYGANCVLVGIILSIKALGR